MKTHKRLAVFDIDGTLFRWQLYHEVVLQLNSRGFFSPEETEKINTVYYHWQARKASFTDFELTTVGILEKNIKGLKVTDFAQIAGEILDSSQEKVYAYTRSLIKKLTEDGYFLLAISGSMQEIVEPFTKLYGFDECIGWQYEQKNGVFTGKIQRATVGNKAALIQEYCKAHNLSLTGSIGVGDSKSDIPMLQLAERAIAFNPTVELLEAAKEFSWDVVIERKNIAYTLRKDSHGFLVLAKTDTY